MISGVVVGYLPKKRVVFLCDIGRGTIVLITALLFISNMLRPWQLFVFTFINSTFEAFRSPSDTSIFTQILSKDKYEHAISFDSSGTTIAELIGYSAAGILISLITIGGVIIADSITFFICGIIMITLKIKKETLNRDQLTVKQYFKDLKEGIKYVSSKKLILSVCLFAGLFNMLVVPFNSMQAAYVKLVLKKGPGTVSLMAVSFLIAMSIGGMIVPLIKKKFTGFQIFIAGGIVIGISYLIFSQLGLMNGTILVYIPVTLASALMGFSVPMLMVPIKVSLISNVEQEFITRSISFVNSLALCSVPLGGGITGLLCGFLSLQTVFLIFSIAVIVLFISQLFNKSLKQL
ncbi:MAG: MFS transporter [Clostridiaceae bacterium]